MFLVAMIEIQICEHALILMPPRLLRWYGMFARMVITEGCSLGIPK